MRLPAIAVVPLALAAGGCGTLVNQAGPGSLLDRSPDAIHDRPYGGVQYSGLKGVQYVGHAAGFKVRGVHQDTDLHEAVGFATFFLLLDVPLCLVADTLLLPWDVRKVVRGWGPLPPDTGGPIVISPPEAPGEPGPPATPAGRPAFGSGSP